MFGPSMGRRGQAVLVLSLALNLLLLGMFAGARLEHRPANLHPDHGHWRQTEGWAGRGGPLFAALPLSEAPGGLGNSPSRPHAALARGCVAQRERFEALLAGLRARPFDRARVARLLAAQREVAVARQVRAEAALLDALAGISDAERQRYVERLDALVSRSRCVRHPRGPKGPSGHPAPLTPYPRHRPGD